MKHMMRTTMLRTSCSWVPPRRCIPEPLLAVSSMLQDSILRDCEGHGWLNKFNIMWTLQLVCSLGAECFVHNRWQY